MNYNLRKLIDEILNGVSLESEEKDSLIKELGQLECDPPTINYAGLVIDGNHRCQFLRELANE